MGTPSLKSRIAVTTVYESIIIGRVGVFPRTWTTSFLPLCWLSYISFTVPFVFVMYLSHCFDLKKRLVASENIVSPIIKGHAFENSFAIIMSPFFFINS